MCTNLENLVQGPQHKKIPKRHHDQVSPLSPELSLACIKSTVQGELKFLHDKFANVTQTLDFYHKQSSQDKIIRLCSDLGIQVENNDIVRAHCTGQKRRNTQPIIVRLYQFKVKQRVLKAKPKFWEIGIIVVEDFSSEILERRKSFKPILNAAFNSDGQYKARLVVHKLLLNGRNTYTPKRTSATVYLYCLKEQHHWVLF